MNSETTASELNPASSSKTNWPEWIWTTNHDALPDSLDWCYGNAWPPIGSYGEVYRNGKYLVTGTITHYFHVAGKLYLIISVGVRVEWLKLAPGDSLIAIYGDDFISLDDDDDEPEYPLLVLSDEERAAALIPVAQAAQDNQESDLPF